MPRQEISVFVFNPVRVSRLLGKSPVLDYYVYIFRPLSRLPVARINYISSHCSNLKEVVSSKSVTRLASIIQARMRNNPVEYIQYFNVGVLVNKKKAYVSEGLLSIRTIVIYAHIKYMAKSVSVLMYEHELRLVSFVSNIRLVKCRYLGINVNNHHYMDIPRVDHRIL